MNEVGTPNAKTRTKHDVRLTKDQYSALLMRVLGKAKSQQQSQPQARPMPSMPQGIPGLPQPLNAPSPMSMAPGMDEGANARLQALAQQLQGMQAPQAPGMVPMPQPMGIMRGNPYE